MVLERDSLFSLLFVQVVRCRREEVAEHLPAAHLAVPLAAKLDAAALAHARRLKVILQYGVGLEGVDVAAVRLSCPQTRRL